MQTNLIDGKKIASILQQRLTEEVQEMKKKPCLAVILVGDDPASIIYTNRKKKVAEQIGIEISFYQFSPVMTQDALIEFIVGLNKDKGVDGIIVQLPLPSHFNTNQVIESIDPDKDVDGLCALNLGYLMINRPFMVSCTPLACLHLIKSVCSDLAGKHAVVVGRSRLVGRPLAQLLLNENCTVTSAHSFTQNLAKICKEADILVSATGQAGLIKRDFVKKGAIVIDVGITRLENGKITGDVAFEEVNGQAGFLTPVPGGVGPMTVMKLLENVVKKKRLAEKG